MWQVARAMEGWRAVALSLARRRKVMLSVVGRLRNAVVAQVANLHPYKCFKKQVASPPYNCSLARSQVALSLSLPLA